jgi:glycosyltransferase involved in cell wall biosynthesis
VIWILDLTERTPEYSALFAKSLESQGLPICHLRNGSRQFISISKILFKKKSKRRIKRAFVTIEYYFNFVIFCARLVVYRPSILHVQWLPGLELKYPLDLWILRSIYRCKIVHTVHNVLPHVNRTHHKKNFELYYALVDCLIFHNESSLKSFTSHFGMPLRYEIIPHGLMFERNIRPNIELNTPIKLLLLGPIREYKGYLKFASVFNSLESHSFSLRVAGYTQNQFDIMTLKEMKNVEFLNAFLSEQDFLREIDHCDYGVLPYESISDSGLLFAFLSRGIPVILSSIPRFIDYYHQKSILQHLLLPKDIYSESLQAFLDDLKNLNYRSVLDNTIDLQVDYLWESIGPRYLQLYEELSNS